MYVIHAYMYIHIYTYVCLCAPFILLLYLTIIAQHTYVCVYIHLYSYPHLCMYTYHEEPLYCLALLVERRCSSIVANNAATDDVS